MSEIEFRIESSMDDGRVVLIEYPGDDPNDETLKLRAGSEDHLGWVHFTRREALALAGALRSVAITLED